MILATAFVLTASGGIGVTAASAATPVTPPADTSEPVVTATVTITPTAAPAETVTDSPTATPTTEVPLVGPFLGALHGEVVVPTKDGCGTVTVFTQTGQAVAVADDSITVRSQDGFERSYAIDDSTQVLTARRGGEIRQDAWISVVAAAQPGTPDPAPESPAPVPSATPTDPEATPTAPETTPAAPGATPTTSEGTPAPAEGTPTSPESTPTPLPGGTSAAPAPPGETSSAPPQTEETTPAAPQGESAAAAYVFDLSRPSKRLWYLSKNSPYALKWHSGKPAWRAPDPCPTPTAIPTEPPAATPDPATPPADTPAPTETAAPTPEPTLTETPTPTPTS
ncbi:hypothetical protein [Microbispora sp. CA-102843]|uniref:hypothetical protein n=1 Tax=Microbispora sp. CA-102843 TaxID=3239952 RepID=UPI003D948633